MYVLLYLEFYAPTFTSAEILRAAELFPSSSDSESRQVVYIYIILSTCAVARVAHLLTNGIPIATTARVKKETLPKYLKQ